MSDYVPSIFLLVPGPWGDSREVQRVLETMGCGLMGEVALEAGGIVVDLVEDDELGAAFAWGRSGPLADGVTEQVDACGRAALIEIGCRLDEDPAKVAAVGRALRDAGGIAVRTEGSGAASTWDRWLENLEEGTAAGVYVSAVVHVGEEDGTIFTCGMHQFGLPDAQISGLDPRDASSWLDEFCVFQIDEGPALGSGHTFRPSGEVPVRVLERWPDHRHHPNDGRHNPFGVWRFLPEGVSGIEACNPIPTIIPPLVATLAAAERSKGAPLTRREVEALVERAPAIAMDLRDARALERSRGYADIEPELGFDQWQVVRATL